ncbi:DUF2142 domain-containing protein [Acetobacter orientalis]|nr:DUF2142 domain-containing protein [Acetobacter orientalis]
MHKIYISTIIKLAKYKTLITFYAIFSIINGLLCITLTPPFQVADEPNHFMRVLQIAQGNLVGIRQSKTESGALLPMTAPMFAASFNKLPFAPQEKVTADMLVKAMSLRWPSSLTFVSLPNTVIYPPTSYVGAVTGVLWAHTLHATPFGTLYLARIGNLVINVGVSVCALLLSPEAGLFLVAILILPMSISLMASCSQDGMVLALMALGIACTLRWFREHNEKKRFVFACVGGISLGCVAAAKAPYIIMVCAPLLFLNRHNIRYALTSCFNSVIVFSVWFFWGIRPTITTSAPDGASASEQFIFIVHHPIQLIEAFFRTIYKSEKYFSQQFIGVLGWLDLHFPAFVYMLVKIFLIFITLTFLLSAKGFSNKKLSNLRISGLIILILSTIFGIFTSLYLTWTPVGRPVIEGVQGRYFLPVVMLVALAPSLIKNTQDTQKLLPTKIYEIQKKAAVNLSVIIFMLFCYFTLYLYLLNRYW